MKTRVVCSLALILILAICIPAAATETTDQTPAYEMVVPLEFNQIYQVSVEHELMVVERYGSYLDPQRSLVTFGGEEVLAGTDILLSSDGILCRTRDWSGGSPPTDLYSFYDWSLTLVIPESPTRIVTTDSHNLLLMEVTGSSAHANLSYGERRLYDIETGKFTNCGYGSDGDEITLLDGTTVIPDRYGYAAFAEKVGTGTGHLQLRSPLGGNPSVYSSTMQLLLDSEGTKYYTCNRNDTVCQVIPTEYGNIYELLYPQGENVITAGPLAGMTFNLMNANHPDSCYYTDDNNLVILRSAETARCGVIRILREDLGSTFYLDVPKDAWFHDPVDWALAKGITAGTVATTFNTGSTAVTFTPDRTCTMKEILTFLWRAAGKPEPTSESSFYNIGHDTYYYKAALWAKEQGMVSGDTFPGDEPCTRAMTVTFLWQYVGSPATEGESFDDVSADADYVSAVAWAVSRGITYGTGNGRFSPEITCTRGQIVTFLYRAFVEQK